MEIATRSSVPSLGVAWSVTNGATTSQCRVSIVEMSNSLFGKDTLNNLELEKNFQDRVVHLARLYGWKVYHVPDSRRSSLAGYPDLTMWNVKKGRLIFAELKREKGRVSPAQDSVLDDLDSLGLQIETYVWRPSMWEEIVRTLK